MSLGGSLDGLRYQGGEILTEVDSKKFLRNIGIPLIESHLATSRSQAVRLARALGFPVVLKVVSPDIPHKSDVGGVRVSLHGVSHVRNAYDEILASTKVACPNAMIHGVAVQTMAPPGIEVIMGMTRDSQFGPVLMFGLGGVTVEIYRDVSFSLVPLTPRDARRMVREIRGFPILEGYRGQLGVDIDRLEQALLQLSCFVEQHPEVEQLDLNPVLAYPDRIVAVDARVVLREAQG